MSFRSFQRLMILSPIVFVLSACGTASLMDGIISSWQGAPLADVIQRWGLPSREMTVGNQRYYVWNYEKSAFIPQTSTTTGTVTSAGGFSSQTTTSGGYALSGYCERVLQVGDGDVIVGGSWRGNNCPFMEAFEYATWRNPKTEGSLRP